MSTSTLCGSRELGREMVSTFGPEFWEMQKINWCPTRELLTMEFLCQGTTTVEQTKSIVSGSYEYLSVFTTRGSTSLCFWTKVGPLETLFLQPEWVTF